MLTVSDVRYADLGSYFCCLPSNCSGNIQDNCQHFVLRGESLSSSIAAISLFLFDYDKRNIDTWMKRKVSHTAIVLVDAQRWNIHERNKIWYTIYIYRILHGVCVCDIYAELLTYQKSAEWTVPWLPTTHLSLKDCDSFSMSVSPMVLSNVWVLFPRLNNPILRFEQSCTLFQHSSNTSHFQ